MRALRELVSITATGILLAGRWLDDRASRKHIRQVEAERCACLVAADEADARAIDEAQRIVRRAWLRICQCEPYYGRVAMAFGDLAGWSG